jgi:hypothetical protein
LKFFIADDCPHLSVVPLSSARSRHTSRIEVNRNPVESFTSQNALYNLDYHGRFGGYDLSLLVVSVSQLAVRATGFSLLAPLAPDPFRLLF